jgi:hypothetical protein
MSSNNVMAAGAKAKAQSGQNRRGPGYMNTNSSARKTSVPAQLKTEMVSAAGIKGHDKGAG